MPRSSESPDRAAGEGRPPMDTDASPRDRDASLSASLPSVGAVALGGAAGAGARYGVERLWPAGGGDLPWATFGVNVGGCAVMGVVVVLLMEVWTVSPLVRPFLSTGFLGGFTTLSAYAADTERLARLGEPEAALLYCAATLAAALAAVALASSLTRRIASALRAGARA
ncbi:fluoride efflux transporter FluC [Streptomyces marincola]|nr:CrcB family protein [Streptomyces marincola]